jgi:hypothetical protein
VGGREVGMFIPPRLASSPYLHVAPTHRQALRSIGQATDAAEDHLDDMFTANKDKVPVIPEEIPRRRPEELPATKSVAEYRPSLTPKDTAFYAAIQLCKRYLERRASKTTATEKRAHCQAEYQVGSLLRLSFNI